MGYVEIIMVPEKSTKNTERYTAQNGYGEESLVDTLYIKKSAFAELGHRPDKITIAVNWDD